MKTFKTKSGYLITRVLKGRSNAFMLSGNGKNILIDTGPGRGWKKLKDHLNSLNIKKIDYLILTHSHYDHAENSSRIKKEYGAKVIVNKAEASFLEKGENPVIHGTFLLIRFIVKRLYPLFTSRLHYEPCMPDILVDQTFDLNEFGFSAIICHTPGHSIGSQSVIIDNEIALVGDAMFGIFKGSIFPPFFDNEENLIKSWIKLLTFDCRIYLPSHGTENRRHLVEMEVKKRQTILTQ